MPKKGRPPPCTLPNITQEVLVRMTPNSEQVSDTKLTNVLIQPNLHLQPEGQMPPVFQPIDWLRLSATTIGSWKQTSLTIQEADLRPRLLVADHRDCREVDLDHVCAPRPARIFLAARG